MEHSNLSVDRSKILVSHLWTRRCRFPFLLSLFFSSTIHQHPNNVDVFVFRVKEKKHFDSGFWYKYDIMQNDKIEWVTAKVADSCYSQTKWTR